MLFYVVFQGLPTNLQAGGKDRVRNGSGEKDEHNLWKHLTKEQKTSSSSVEFVPAEKMCRPNEGETMPVFGKPRVVSVV